MTPKQRVFRLTFPSNPKHIGKVEGFLNKVSKAQPLDEIQFHKLMVAVTEAVNNAIIHANKSDPNKKVQLCCEIRADGLNFTITDEGKGFKLEQIKNPLNEQNLLRESGRGIFLMRTLMDKVDYTMTPEGVTVHLWLALNK